MHSLGTPLQQQVIVLAGATSVGKSAVARQLCRALGPGKSEIVLADSVQIYRHMDIGSNKPSSAELAETVHHMVNICDPHDPFSSGDFVKQAVPLVYDILSRGKVPIIVGGSTMWLQWLIHGTPDAPKADPAVVKEAAALLREASEAGDWDAAVAIVEQHDPVRVRNLGRNDWYRIQRYLEVALSLRASSSSSSSSSSPSSSSFVVGERSKALEGLDLRCFFLSETREQLYRTIDARCEDMLRGGLVQEVASLLLQERLTPAAVPARAIGYRQTIEYLLGLGLGASDKSRSTGVAAFDSYVKDFATATRNYAKRQLQWYRKDKAFLWLRIQRPDPLALSSDLEPYDRVAQEVLFWCSQAQSNFRQNVKQQLQRASAVYAVRQRKHHGHGLLRRADENEWLAVAALVHSGELKPPKVRKGMTDQEVAESWVSVLDLATAKRCAFAPFKDSTGEDESEDEGEGEGEEGAGDGTGGGEAVLARAAEAEAQAELNPLRLPTPAWSAQDVMIRVAELGSKGATPTGRALREYQSRFASSTLDAKERDFDAVIRAAEDKARELSERHPALMAEFAREWGPTPDAEN